MKYGRARILTAAALAAVVILLLLSARGGIFRPGAEVLFRFRLFRSLLGFLVGGSLALSGTVFQAVFRNPLADPYILGISSGAAVGAAAVFVFVPASLLFLCVPAGAFAGALATLAAVLVISGSARSTDRLLLSGVVTGIVVSSMLIYLVSISDSVQLAGVTWWILGDLQGGSPALLCVLGALAAAALLSTRFFANELNALAVGDEAAAVRGVPVRKMRLFFVMLASLLASSCVAAAGIIGFAGLVMPHIVRLLAGSDHRRILLPAFLAGGCFLQLCDLLSVLFSGAKEMPVGVVSSCAGGILFLFLLSRRRCA
ncbi:MAG: iron ABC transporter permease [Lentisphaeria bacterium]|nr:iron ABC transporter permease [Lentisphaeria bacterium]